MSYAPIVDNKHYWKYKKTKTAEVGSFFASTWKPWIQDWLWSSFNALLLFCDSKTFEFKWMLCSYYISYILHYIQICFQIYTIRNILLIRKKVRSENLFLSTVGNDFVLAVMSYRLMYRDRPSGFTYMARATGAWTLIGVWRIVCSTMVVFSLWWRTG